MTRLWLLTLLVGCSSVLGIENLRGPDDPVDGNPGRDAAVDVVIPGQATIAGRANIVTNGPGGGQPLTNATLDLIVDNQAQIGSSITKADGSYAITFATQGNAIDGSLFVEPLATFDLPQTQVFPPILTGDLAFDFSIFDRPTIQMLAQLSGEPVDQTRAFLMVVVVDAMTNQPAPGIVIQIAIPGVQVHYANVDGLPTATQTTTSSSGIAYLFNLPGNIGPISAAVNGVELGSRNLGSPPGQQLILELPVTTSGQ